MIEVLPRSRIIHVEFELALPADATKAEVLEWVALHLWGSSMSSDSPLDPFGVEAVGEPTLTDTGLHMHEEVIVHDASRSTIRRWRDPKPFAGASAIDQIMAAREAGR